MVSRRLLYLFVIGMVLLGVSFTVLMVFYALVTALGDTSGARALFWAATVCLIALVVDMVLLLAALGIRAVDTAGSNDTRQTGDD